MSVIQFESVVEGNIIRIPEEYINQIPDKVTVIFADKNSPQFRPKAKKEKPASIEEFSDLKLDTSNWKFDREEANERH